MKKLLLLECVAALAAAVASAADPKGADSRLTAVSAMAFLEYVTGALPADAEKGLPVLDVDRNWRIGATAVRLLAFAEEKGAKLRNM